MRLESEELAEIGKKNDDDGGLDIELKPSIFDIGPRVYDTEKVKHWKAKVSKMAQETSCSEVKLDLCR